jgi:hypothetical protein
MDERGRPAIALHDKLNHSMSDADGGDMLW